MIVGRTYCDLPTLLHLDSSAQTMGTDESLSPATQLQGPCWKPVHVATSRCNDGIAFLTLKWGR